MWVCTWRRPLQFGEYAADHPFSDIFLMGLDVLLQSLPPFIAHHHVNRVIGAKEICDPDNIRVIDLGEGPAFLEKALHPMAKD